VHENDGRFSVHEGRPIFFIDNLDRVGEHGVNGRRNNAAATKH
jgi:hypothetical protein